MAISEHKNPCPRCHDILVSGWYGWSSLLIISTYGTLFDLCSMYK